MNWNAKTRVQVVCYGLAVVFTAFSFRLVHLQVGKHEEYSALAAQNHVRKQPIYARRGSIFDVNQELVAGNLPVKMVVADGSQINDPAGAAEVLQRHLGVDAAHWAGRLNTDRRYMVIQRQVREDEIFELRDELRERGLRGIYFEHDVSRIYPNGSMLSHVVGFLDQNNQGALGVEATMNRFLQGHDGYRYIERDRMGREIVPYRGQERAARDGNHVNLTIDMGLQAIVESELDRVVEEFEPESAVVVMMEPRTGRILAMASRPHFDLNDRSQYRPELTHNQAVISMLEPGSTFKIVTAAAALNDGLVEPTTPIYCENGRFRYGGRTLRDHRPYGQLSVHEVLVKSSNIGSAKLGIQLGDERLYEYVRRFGFGERTGIQLPGEISGLVHPPHRWSRISITRIPMGHEVAVTPLQLAAAMGVVANGGTLMAPLIVDSVYDREGRLVASYDPTPVRRVVNPRVAAMVRQALKDVTAPGGTATRAAVEGYGVAGKTGTAQKPSPQGGYLSNEYIVSFVGYFPADDPAAVCVVIVDQARTEPGANFGGLVAAPVFSRIAERSLRHLDISPRREEPAGEDRREGSVAGVWRGGEPGRIALTTVASEEP